MALRPGGVQAVGRFMLGWVSIDKGPYFIAAISEESSI